MRKGERNARNAQETKKEDEEKEEKEEVITMMITIRSGSIKLK